VIDYLEAENAYTKAVMNSEAFEKKLYDEFLSRIKQTDESVPYRYIVISISSISTDDSLTDLLDHSFDTIIHVH